MSWLQRYRLRQYVRNSLWVPPLIGIAAALVAVRGLYWIDSRMGWQSSFDPEAARIVLVSLASAVFTFIVYKIVATLMFGQLLPLCIGLYLREKHAALANHLVRPFVTLSKVLNLALIGLILAVQFRMLAQIRLTGYVGMLALVSACAAAGWLLGGRGPESRRTLAITTAVRNVGVSLVIVTAGLGGTPAVTAATAYAVFQTVFMAIVAIGWGWLASVRPAVAEQAMKARSGPC